MKLIIQIPCYNEAETLEIALNDLPKKLDGVDEIEYLIINDGSKDDTVEVAKRWGVHHVVNFKQNKGLAKGFMAGIDGCLRNGADIIVNTDADNQYCADDIATLIRPILSGEADMVIGARPIDETEHFSFMKKKLQHFGSWVVRKASNTDIPDAPSGFRAYSREAAMHLNVVNDYTYTLETIVQAGREKIAITSVPVRTNAELRPSRLFNSIWGYVKKSMNPSGLYDVQASKVLQLSGGLSRGSWAADRSAVFVFYGAGKIRRACSVPDPGMYPDHHGIPYLYDRPCGGCNCRKPKAAPGYSVSCKENRV